VDFTTEIGSGQTNADGSYSIALTSTPGGPVVVQISGGSYQDEASPTPVTVTLKAGVVLRAAVPSVANGDKIAVTPLTELAYKQTEGVGSFTADNINTANGKIAKLFQVDDIIKSQPFDVTQNAPASAGPDDKRYASALGVFSQYVFDNKGTQALDDALKTVLDDLGKEVHDSGGLQPATLTSINLSIDDFNNNSRNKGGSIQHATFRGGTLTLSTSGDLGTNLINGVDLTIALPSGVTVKADATTGEASPGVLEASSQAAKDSFVSGKFTKNADGTGSLHLAIANAQSGFKAGEFMHVNIDLDAGVALPSNDKFTITVNKVVGGSTPSAPATALTGISVTSTLTGL
jgi:hypothetical protein